MKELFFIGLLGVFAYHCQANGREFNGTSLNVKNLLMWAGAINYFAFIVLLIVSFWHFSWWMPIVTFVASTILGGITAIFFQRNLIGMIASFILVEVFFFLSCFAVF